MYDVVIIGLGRFGRRLTEILDEHSGINTLCVDYDPSVIEEFKAKGKDIIYGDMEDPDLLEQIPYEKCSMVVSTVTNNELSLQLIKIMGRSHYKGKFFVTASTEIEHQQLKASGLDDERILRPHQMAAHNFYNSFLQAKK